MSRLFSVAGAILLVGMVAYHGSGIVSISADMTQSDAPNYLKNIFPVLFLNTSLYLATLAAFALLAASSSGAAARGLNALIAVSSFANAGLGAFLNEWTAAGVLGFIGMLFTAASLTVRQE
ncbi:MAG: hypothetical protein AAGA09_03120 [Pseudomonadota bacterium]